ncbi:MAG: hypothetical protein FWG58_00850, partial [Methanomassiliicoccaceae archaeon]|nr:hypothetical protein [Methanomassiliicoccaceae archaeon]
MFCFQCEQTAKGTGCTVNGACGKKAETADLQDVLTGELIVLAKAAGDGPKAESTCRIVVDGLFTAVTNVNFNDETIRRQIDTVRKERKRIAPRSGDGGFDMSVIWEG